LPKKEVTPNEASIVAAHLAVLAGEEALPAAQSLAALLDGPGRRELANAVRRWHIDAVADR
jgi:hypothetical protein